MQIIRDALSIKSISGHAAETIISSWRQSSRKQYLSAIRKWLHFCTKRKIDPIKAAVSEGINFLQDEFASGASYSSLNTARSALSFILPVHGHSVTFGMDHLVRKVFRGVFNLTRPKPRYDAIWDMDIVLKYFNSLPENNALNVKLLSYKLATLCALVTGQRVQTLSILDLKFVSFLNDLVFFHLSDHVKHSRRGKIVPPVKLLPYTDNKKLCVINCLLHYLRITMKFRKSSRLFIALNVSSQTIANWIKKILCFAGPDLSLYRAHSTRSASCSKASMKNVPVDTILSYGGWSRTSTFAKFYNKPLTDVNPFANSILHMSS